MRLAIPILEATGQAYFPIFMRKSGTDEEFKNLNSKYEKLEEFLVQNANDKSPFAMATENPTQLDFHIFAHVERMAMMKNSVLHDSIWARLNWDKYPRTLALLKAVRDRPEFRGILANPKPYHQYLEKNAARPPGDKQ